MIIRDSLLSIHHPHTHTHTTQHDTNQDTLTLEASLEPSETPPLILALARRLHHRSLHLTTPDIFRYATLLPDGEIKGLDPTKFVVYTDTPAGARRLLEGANGNAPWVEAVTRHREFFQLIHVTDQSATPLTYVRAWGLGVRVGGCMHGSGRLGLFTMHHHHQSFILLSCPHTLSFSGHGTLPRTVFRVKLTLPPLLGRRGQGRWVGQVDDVQIIKASFLP